MILNNKTIMKQSVLNVMRDIAIHLNNEAQEGEFSYIQQREIILRVFKEGKSRYDVPTIILRLTVIDSLYSTNAQYSYFSIEDMANEIFSLGSNEKDAVEYFKQIALGGNDSKNLFNKEYGIRKNCNAGSKQMSLMSKYAYYTLLSDNSSALGFPIYDSLVIKTYPLVCKKLPVTGKDIKTDDITEYVASLDVLRKELFGNDDRFEGMQQFDILDAYLWRMGKLCSGNYSLLLIKEDYKRFISNLSLNAPDDQALWNRFNAKLSKDVVKTTYKSKTGKETEKYKINFNAIIEYQCRSLETKSIVSELKSGIIFSLIEHWKEYYVEYE